MVFDKVKEIINDTLSCGEDIITLDAVELCMTIEEAFDITIPEDKIADLKTVKDIVEFVESQI